MKVFLIFLCLLICTNLNSEEKYKVSACAIFQNEARFLEEWINHHRSIGVEHFYMYNNNSTDGYLEVLQPLVEKGIIELIEWPSIQEENDWAHFSFTTQISAYNDALDRSKGVSKWLAIIDTDEFIVPVKTGNLTTLLETYYCNVSGLCINWQCYGTSHIEKVADGQLRNTLIYKAHKDYKLNYLSKCIVQPLYVKNCPNPHYCLYNDSHWAIDSNYVRTDVCCSDVNIDVIRINHYWTRDNLFFQTVKIARYLKWGASTETVQGQAYDMNSTLDPILCN